MYRWLSMAVCFIVGGVLGSTVSQTWHNYKDVKLLQRVVLEQQAAIQEQQEDQDKLWNVLMKKKVLTWDDVNPVLPGGGRKFPSPEERSVN